MTAAEPLFLQPAAAEPSVKIVTPLSHLLIASSAAALMRAGSSRRPDEPSLQLRHESGGFEVQVWGELVEGNWLTRDRIFQNESRQLFATSKPAVPLVPWLHCTTQGSPPRMEIRKTLCLLERFQAVAVEVCLVSR